jgi:hypothetical protein
MRKETEIKKSKRGNGKERETHEKKRKLKRREKKK